MSEQRQWAADMLTDAIRNRELSKSADPFWKSRRKELRASMRNFALIWKMRYQAALREDGELAFWSLWNAGGAK